MKTLIIIAIDISHLLPHISLEKHHVRPRQTSSLLRAAQAVPLGPARPQGMEGWSCIRDALDDHLQDTQGSLSILPPLWTDFPKHRIYLSGKSLPISRKTEWFQTICLSMGVTTSIAR